DLQDLVHPANPVIFVSYLFPCSVAFEVWRRSMVFTGGAGLGGSFTGDFNFAITSAIARSSCGSLPAITDCGSLSTSISGSTPYPSIIHSPALFVQPNSGTLT